MFLQAELRRIKGLQELEAAELMRKARKRRTVPDPADSDTLHYATAPPHKKCDSTSGYMLSLLWPRALVQDFLCGPFRRVYSTWVAELWFWVSCRSKHLGNGLKLRFNSVWWFWLCCVCFQESPSVPHMYVSAIWIHACMCWQLGEKRDPSTKKRMRRSITSTVSNSSHEASKERS